MINKKKTLYEKNKRNNCEDKQMKLRHNQQQQQKMDHNVLVLFTGFGEHVFHQ